MISVISNANATEDFSTLKGVVGDSLTDSELASIEAKGNFPKGYCTWYVDTLVRSNWGLKNGTAWQGNAEAWYSNASKAGFKVGSKPQAGSIVVYNTKFYAGYGHVAYVTGVNGSKFTVTEMNVKGFNVISTRSDTIVNNNKIAGFIYRK
jgi:surface antigen